MGVVVNCDFPDCEAGPLDQSKVVKVLVVVNDPESGQGEVQKFYCVDHGDKVYDLLESAGIDGLQ